MTKTPYPRSGALTIAVVITAGFLGACAATRNAAERALFDFGPPPVGGAAGIPLRVEVTMPAWLDNGDIAYRLAYDDASRLRQYAGSRWAGRPSRLVAARLASRFAGGPAKCTLSVELDEFAQHFPAEGGSTQQIGGRWAVASANAGRLAGAMIRLAAPAGADAASGARTAAALVDRLGDELLEAVRKLPACGA